MVESSEDWKQKFYDQLDRLEQKEQGWEKLESLLKRTIGRLSLAAEGQNPSLDKHLRQVRASIKDKVDPLHLEQVLDDLSELLTRLDETRASPDRKITAALEQLLQQIRFSSQQSRQLKKLQKSLSRNNDETAPQRIAEMAEWINRLSLNESSETHKPGILNRLFAGRNATETGTDTHTGSGEQGPACSDILSGIVQQLPWPGELKPEAAELQSRFGTCDSDTAFQQQLERMQSLLQTWKQHHIPLEPESESTLRPEPDPIADSGTATPAQDVSVEAYRQWVMGFLDRLSATHEESGRLSALRVLVRDAKEKDELDHLSTELIQLLDHEKHHPEVGNLTTADDGLDQPSIQELLIRLLEQLAVPPDLHHQVDAMKLRLETVTPPADWKQLLKDVVSLINSIRQRLQEEKQDFEGFLQQITTRLNELDQYLSNELVSIETARDSGDTFDNRMTTQMHEIRDDIQKAAELDQLKQMVQQRLDGVMEHLLAYRKSEQENLGKAQANVMSMQNKMQDLEKEASKLRTVIVEKNRQALFDVLTGIPNRLAYEQKISEEIARWQRFGNPLSLAIWDVDFFKKVNDTYGHKAGDKVLRTIAQLLNQRIRKTDFLARYGGEEFVMLLPGTKQEETLRLVNDLREQVEQCGFHYQGEPVQITVSCGISSFGEGDTSEKVFDRADRALYKAKKNGRNQCVAAACLSD